MTCRFTLGACCRADHRVRHLYAVLDEYEIVIPTPDTTIEHRQVSGKTILVLEVDLALFKKTAGQSIRTAFERRKERILNDRSVEDVLGIPVRTSSTPRPPVPARRAHVTLQARKARAAFVPEPVLEDAIYQDVPRLSGHGRRR